MAVNRRVVSNTIRDRLSDQLPSSVSVSVADRSDDPPAVIVDPLPGGDVTAMLDDAETVQQGTLPYQLTCVGVAGDAGREQAEQLAADSIDALAGWTSDIILHVEADVWGGVRPDDTQQPPVWISQPILSVTAVD